jgi:hypothetical protein
LDERPAGGSQMRKWYVSLDVRRIVSAVVEGRNEQEARDNAYDFANLYDESTESEEIEGVEVMEQVDAPKDKRKRMEIEKE